MYGSTTARITMMPLDELAVKLLVRNKGIQVIDARAPEEFAQDHIPTAINIPYDSLSHPECRTVLRAGGKTNIFYSIDEQLPGRAAVLSRQLGDRNPARALAKGFDKFQSELVNYQLDSTLRPDEQKFRARAKEQLAILKEEATRQPVVIEKPVKIRGGC